MRVYAEKYLLKALLRLVFAGLKRHNFSMWNFRILSSTREQRDVADTRMVVRKGCDAKGCGHLGEFKAPKSRYDLRAYYWFCLDHVREYNANWDFFKGMSRLEIEHHMYKTAVWDRPTWKSTEAGLHDNTTRQKIYDHFMSGDGVFGDFSLNGEENAQEAHINISSIPHPTVEALAVMDLQPPVGWDEVKTRYKQLAKKHHPDANKGDPAAEELFKKINIAYTILKLSYQTYAELDK